MRKGEKMGFRLEMIKAFGRIAFAFGLIFIFSAFNMENPPELMSILGGFLLIVGAYWGWLDLDKLLE